MHIILHTQYYPPEVGAPQARLSELASGLVRRGHRVTVLTSMPNYPQGRIYPGYKGFFRMEKIDGVDVIRTAIYPAQSAQLLPRLSGYFSFVFSSLLVGGLNVRSADFLLTESPPLFLGIAGFLLSRWKRARWIFNVSDLWPESVVRLGMLREGIALQVGLMLEAFCYSKAWVVTGQSRSILKNINSRFPTVKTYWFSNGVDSKVFDPRRYDANSRSFLGNKDELIVLYAGLHGYAQGLEQILLAARRFEDSSKIRFVLIGDGPEKKKLLEMARTLGLHNVTFLDPIPKEKMPRIVASVDICLIPLKIYIPGAVPSKLYEAMASGCPVLLIAEGEAADIVNGSQAGIVVKPGDIDAIVRGVETFVADPFLREQMGKAGREVVRKYYDRSKITDKFLKFLSSV